MPRSGSRFSWKNPKKINSTSRIQPEKIRDEFKDLYRSLYCSDISKNNAKVGD